MSDVLGYVVVEWNQASHQPSRISTALLDDAKHARKVAEELQADARRRVRGERYTVHAVMAEEIEEDGRE